MIEFDVPGKPQAQGSKTKNRYGAIYEDNKELGPWRERVALAAHAAMNGAQMFIGPVALELYFVMYRPLSTPKSRTPPPIKKPDADKCARAILDALTGVCFHDDAQVTDLRARKRMAELGEWPGVHVIVMADPIFSSNLAGTAKILGND